MSITIIGILFFVFGFVTWLNGPLIQFFQTSCELSPFEASLVTLSFYIAYFVMALPSSFLLKKMGYKNGLVIGLLVMAAGALLFIPASYTRTFIIFLLGLFILGTGLALLQTAVNPFITIIGNRESAAARISAMGICNKLAGFLSPLLLTAMVMQGIGKLKEENLRTLTLYQRDSTLNEFASRLIFPYAILTIILIVFALIVKFSGLPDQIETDDDKTKLKDFIKQIPHALKNRHLLLGVIAIFLYVGAEVIAGDSLTQFGKYLKLDYSTTLTSYTMAFMVIGYILGIILIPRILKQSKALLISSILGVAFAIGAIISSNLNNSFFNFMFGWLNCFSFINIPIIPNSVFFVTLLGLANALMWPSIWPLALNDIGKYTKIASALLIMGIVGGALIPPSYARLGQGIGFQNALWILIPCYLFILYYAVKGHKVKYSN